MGKNLLRLLAAAAALLATLPAAAAFHLWTMNEVYSNADGSVQFIELTALSGGQQFLGNHTIRSTANAGGGANSFTFPSDLPGNSAGRRFLIGTQGFASLGVVTPDYIVPNGFIFSAGGTINFAEGSDSWSHGGLPTGTLSLNRDGSTDTNSPRNFAGQTGTVPASVPSLNAQGLWWGGAAESGWGVNIAHQGDVLFATWFTYDTDGSQMWLVAPETRRTTGNAFSGPLFRTTGNAFSVVTWNPASIGVTQVGTASFTFTDAFNGAFTSVVNGASRTKPISLQEFGPIPICEPNGPVATPRVYQDLWWAAPAESESGWGVNVNHQANIVFATWFTYGTDNKGIWIVMPRGERVGMSESFTGPLFRTTGPAFNVATWNPALVVATEVGTGTFTFTGNNAGTFAYTVGSVSRTKSILRQVFSTPTGCRNP